MDNDKFLENIDFSQITEEDLENLGLNPEILDEINLSGLSNDDIKDIQNEVFNTLDEEDEEEPEQLQSEITKAEIQSGLNSIDNTLANLTIDLPDYKRFPKYQKVYNATRILRRRFKKCKRHLSPEQKERVKKYFERLLKKIKYWKPNKRQIPGITVNTCYIKHIKTGCGLFIPYLMFRYRPVVTRYYISEDEIPSEAETITENNGYIPPKKETVERRITREEDIIIKTSEDDPGISLKELKQKALNLYQYNMTLFAGKISDVNNYQNIIDLYNKHPTYKRSKTARSVDISKFIYKHFRPFELKENLADDVVRIRIKLKNKQRYCRLQEVDRHKKYKKVQAHILKNKISKEELIEAFNRIKNSFKTAEYFHVSYNTFKKYARLYGIDTKKYWNEYITKTKNREILPNFGDPTLPRPNKYISYIRQKEFNKLYKIEKPEYVYSKTASFIPDFYEKRKLFTKKPKQEENNIITLLYNGPFIYDINVKNNKLYELKEHYVKNKLKENKCCICGRNESTDNPLLISFIDGKLDNLSVDNIQIKCYHCLITERLFNNVKNYY